MTDDTDIYRLPAFYLSSSKSVYSVRIRSQFFLLRLDRDELFFRDEFLNGLLVAGRVAAQTEEAAQEAQETVEQRLVAAAIAFALDGDFALDAFAGEPARARGMSAVAGRIRKKENYIKMFVLSHNTLRGGAGGSVLNAELAVSRRLL